MCGAQMRRALVLAVALLLQSGDAQGSQKTMQTLIQEVLDGKPAAALTARQLGPSANHALIELTRHDSAVDEGIVGRMNKRT